jgi:hypothetical protein
MLRIEFQQRAQVNCSLNPSGAREQEVLTCLRVDCRRPAVIAAAMVRDGFATLSDLAG